MICIFYQSAIIKSRKPMRVMHLQKAGFEKKLFGIQGLGGFLLLVVCHIPDNECLYFDRFDKEVAV